MGILCLNFMSALAFPYITTKWVSLKKKSGAPAFAFRLQDKPLAQEYSTEH